MDMAGQLAVIGVPQTWARLEAGFSLGEQA